MQIYVVVISALVAVANANGSDPTFPDDFQWSWAGAVPGLNCVQWTEGSEGAHWNDNYLCWEGRADIGLEWRSWGTIPGKTCVNTNEPSDTAGTWQDNYLCSDPDSPYQFIWKYDGALRNGKCIKIREPGETMVAWNDNYLCDILSTDWNHGYCVTAAGDDQSDGVTKLDSIGGRSFDRQAECLSKCEQIPDHTGCEIIWGQGASNGCYVHTEAVDHGNNKGYHACWIRGPTPAPTASPTPAPTSAPTASPTPAPDELFGQAFSGAVGDMIWCKQGETVFKCHTQGSCYKSDAGSVRKFKPASVADVPVDALGQSPSWSTSDGEWTGSPDAITFTSASGQEMSWPHECNCA